MPFELVSSYRSTGVPSGIFPYDCFVTWGFPFLIGVWAIQANASSAANTAAIGRCSIMFSMVRDSTRAGDALLRIGRVPK